MTDKYTDCTVVHSITYDSSLCKHSSLHIQYTGVFVRQDCFCCWCRQEQYTRQPIPYFWGDYIFPISCRNSQDTMYDCSLAHNYPIYRAYIYLSIFIDNVWIRVEILYWWWRIWQSNNATTYMLYMRLVVSTFYYFVHRWLHTSMFQWFNRISNHECTSNDNHNSHKPWIESIYILLVRRIYPRKKDRVKHDGGDHEENDDDNNDDDDDVLATLIGVLNTNSHELETINGTGLFLSSCLMEHNCQPNCSFTTFRDTLWVTATQEIEPGASISIDYGNLFYRPQKDRQAHLYQGYVI